MEPKLGRVFLLTTPEINRGDNKTWCDCAYRVAQMAKNEQLYVSE
jgi:hypothetical protein